MIQTHKVKKMTNEQALEYLHYLATCWNVGCEGIYADECNEKVSKCIQALKIIMLKNPDLSKVTRYGNYETYRRYEYTPPYDFFLTKEEWQFLNDIHKEFSKMYFERK